MSKLIEAQVNECFGRVWLPFIILSLMILNMMSNLVAIKLHLGPSVTLVGVTISAASFTFLFLIFYISSLTVFLSNKALREKMNQTRSSNPFMTKSIRACQPLAIKSGTFRILDRIALTIFVSSNIDYTVSLLLVF